MKKVYGIFLLACFMLQPFAGNAQEYFTISQIYKQIPEHWTQVYETKWRTVSIDVQPIVPQADKLPVLKVVPEWEVDLSGFGEGWTTEINDRGTFMADLGNLYQEEHDVLKGEKGEQSTTNYYPPFNVSTNYSDNSDLTLIDVLSQLKIAMKSIDSELDGWRYDLPICVQINSTVSLTTGMPLLPDSYSVNVYQTLHGVPVLCHALSGVGQQKDEEMWFSTGLWFIIRTPSTFNFFGRQVKITELLAEDMPLCDFATVKSSIEKEIEAGHIRKIFDVELGYALYNEPGASRSPGNPELLTAEFYAVPVWQVNCYYIDITKNELRDYTGFDTPERGVPEYKTLIFNAQTGEMMDRNNNRKGCGDYSGFISWEKAGGNQ